MNFAELKTEVSAIVKRPDLDSLVESSIRAAMLKIHTANFWTRDIQELAVAFTYPNVLTDWNPRDTFERFRKIAYIRIWNYDESDSDNYGMPGPLLTSTELGDVADYWGFQKEDIYYEAGDLVQIRTRQPLAYSLIGAYRFPKVTVDSVSGDIISWIATDYPWAIIHEAAASVFRHIGFDSMAAAESQEASIQLTILNMQNTQEPSVKRD